MQDGVAVISKGLTPGEKVVVEGQYRLTNGSPVEIDPSAPDDRAVWRASASNA